MKLSNEQLKVISSKLNDYTIIKGNSGCGKTTALVHRAAYLRNNYSICEDDNVLILSYDKNNFKEIEKRYNSIKKDNKYEYYTLLSNLGGKIHTIGLNSLIEEYFNRYKKNNSINYKLILDENDKSNIIKECICEVKKTFNRVRILKEEYIKFFIDEIKWIKNREIKTAEEYQVAKRRIRKYKKGTSPARINKNSTSRKAIFQLMVLYNKRIKENGYIDYEDMLLVAIEQARKDNTNKYVHILVDESEKYTEAEVRFIESLHKIKPYSSITFAVDLDENESAYSNFVKNGKVYVKNICARVRKYSLKEMYNFKENKEYLKECMEKFQYFDLRHKRKFNMMREYGNTNEVIVNDSNENMEYENDELVRIPVFSNIAAGEPIMIDSQQQDNFSIPKCWLKGFKDCFILKVKGDSMINAEICNGDYVVIQKQSSANHNDIVAVNLQGSATLKRLNIGKNKVMLMPENKRYAPITISEEEGVYLIGKAVGIIKK